MKINDLKKQITLEEWRKKASDMKIQYDNLSEIEKDADKKLGEYYYFASVPKIKMIIIHPFNVIEGGKDDDRIHLSRDALFFNLSKEKNYKMIDTKRVVEVLVEKLAPYVDIKELVKDALYDTDPEALKEMYDRVVLKKGKIKDKPGCYKLVIGGKRGLPFEFMLRN